MRKLTKLALGTITVILTGATAVKLSRDFTERVNEKHSEGLPEGFVWIDGMDLTEYDEEEYPYGVPLYNEGDYVILVNPMNGGYWAGMNTMASPVIFEIVDSTFDEDDEEWRYKINPRDEAEEEVGLDIDLSTHWFSERWIDVADKEPMARTLKVAPKSDGKLTELGEEMLESLEIDYLLDTLSYSTDDKERKQVEDRLKEITGGDAE